MIDIRELSIGNWVGIPVYTLDSHVFCEDFEIARGIVIGQVTRLSEDGGYVELRVECNRGIIMQNSNLEPIPITRGILESNGFHETSTDHWVCSAPDAFIAVWLKQGQGIQCKVGEVTLLTQELVVHRLQQAIRLMGVDKEIKL